MCDQAVAIHALTEYAMASGDETALATASAVFDILHERAADFRAGERKSVLTHVHLMSAFAFLRERERIGELAPPGEQLS